MNVFTLFFLEWRLSFQWKPLIEYRDGKCPHKSLLHRIVNIVGRSGRRNQFVQELTYPQSNNGSGSALHATHGIRTAKTKRRERTRSMRRRWRKNGSQGSAIWIVHLQSGPHLYFEEVVVIFAWCMYRGTDQLIMACYTPKRLEVYHGLWSMNGTECEMLWNSFTSCDPTSHDHMWNMKDTVVWHFTRE